MKFLWLIRWTFSEHYKIFTNFLLSITIKTYLSRNSKTISIDAYLLENNNEKGLQIEKIQDYKQLQ